MDQPRANRPLSTVLHSDSDDMCVSFVSVIDSSSCHCGFFTETPVTFTSPLKDQNVPEEQSVTLECELSKPDQKVQWLKNGKEIKPDKKRGIMLKVEGTKHILTIPKALVDDTAEYTVKFKDQETKGKLTVEGEFFFQTKNLPSLWFWGLLISAFLLF